jgi:hypothetical protein
MPVATEVKTAYGEFRDGIRFMHEKGHNAPAYNVFGPNDTITIYTDPLTRVQGTTEYVLAERKAKGIKVPEIPARAKGLLAGRGLETIKCATSALDAYKVRDYEKLSIMELDQGLRDLYLSGHSDSRIARILINKFIAHAEEKSLNYAAENARKLAERFHFNLDMTLKK